MRCSYGCVGICPFVSEKFWRVEGCESLIVAFSISHEQAANNSASQPIGSLADGRNIP